MKVIRDGDRLLQVGKKLPLDRVDAESIGMMTFRGDGPRLFRDAIDRAMRTPEAQKQWYLSLIDTLARTGVVYTQPIPAQGWTEVDSPADLERAATPGAPWLAAAEPSFGSARSGRRLGVARDDRAHQIEVGHAVDVDRRLGERHGHDAGGDARLPRYPAHGAPRGSACRARSSAIATQPTRPMTRIGLLAVVFHLLPELRHPAPARREKGEEVAAAVVPVAELQHGASRARIGVAAPARAAPARRRHRRRCALAWSRKWRTISGRRSAWSPVVSSTGTSSGSVASAAAALVAGVACGLIQRTPPATIARSSGESSQRFRRPGRRAGCVSTRALCSSARTTRTTIGLPAMGVRHLAATPAAAATGSSRPRSAASTMALNARLQRASSCRS